EMISIRDGNNHFFILKFLPISLLNFYSDPVACIVQITFWVPSRAKHWLAFAQAIGSHDPYFIISFLRETYLSLKMLPGIFVDRIRQLTGLPACPKVYGIGCFAYLQVPCPGMSPD